MVKTNRYVTHSIDAHGNMGGSKWKNLTIAGPKAFLAIHMNMGMRSHIGRGKTLSFSVPPSPIL
jgi:hypothetical protein